MLYIFLNQEKLADFENKFVEEKKKRLLARRERRMEERRMKYYREKEEMEQILRDEAVKKG